MGRFVFHAVECCRYRQYSSLPPPANPMTESNSWTHREAVVNGVRLHYVEAGQGPLVILLHGFPEFWYSWRAQIPALAAAGYHVIALDMRGYNLSQKPPRVRDYGIEILARDVAELIRSTGAARATVVGHDWGGAVAWFAPMLYPHLVEKLIVLNAPHPLAFLRELKTPAQLLKSWYQFFFQLPYLPEAMIRARDYAMLRDLLRRAPSRRRAFTKADIRLYKAAIAQPSALTAALNYYRAAFRGGPRGMSRLARRIDVSTLLIWGEQDRYLGLNLTRDLEQWVPRLRLERLADASHWVQNDAPQRVNELMIEFLREADER